MCKAFFVVHLGDAADVSCPEELDRFLAIMGRSGKTWFYTPGNHDGYFTGNCCCVRQPVSEPYRAGIDNRRHASSEELILTLRRV
jgi:hypothetical protein